MPNNSQGVGALIEFGADDAIKKLDTVINLLGQVVNGIDGINKAVNSTTEATEKANKTAEKTFKTMNLDSAIRVLTKGYRTLSKFTNSFVNYIEDLNLLKVAFGDTADEAKSFVENIADVTGYDESTLVRMTATFRQLTSTLGLANEDADLLSKNLTKMSLDISSLYNLNLDTAKYAIQGALTGQPRSIKTHTGADVTQKTLQAEIDRLGINRTVKSLSQAEKAIVTYLSLERQMINANGDLARTIDQPANMLRIFREQLQKAGRSIGNLFIPAIQAVIPYLTAFLMVFNEIVNFLMGLWGIDVDSFWDSMSSGANNAQINFNNLNESIKSTKTGLRGFDKLNVIKTPTSGANATGGIGSVDPKFLEAMKEYDLQLEKIHTKATRIRDTIMKWLGFTQDTNGEWQWSAKLLGENILNTIKKIWEWLKKNWEMVVAIGLVIAGFTILGKLKDTASGLDKTSKASKNLAKGAKKAGEGLKIMGIGIAGLAIMAGVSIIIKEFNDLLKTMGEYGFTAGDVGKTLGIVLLEIAGAFAVLALATKLLNWEGIVGALVVLGGMVLILHEINSLLQLMSENGITLGEVAGTLGAVLGIVVGAMGAMATVAYLLSTNPLALVGVLALVGAIAIVLEVLKDVIPPILKAVGGFIDTTAPHLINLIDTIYKGIENIIYAIGTVLPPIINSLGSLWETVFGGIADVVDSVFAGMSGVIDTIGKNIVNVLNTIKSLITTVLKAILDFINKLGPAINGFVDETIKAVTKLVNFLVSAIEYAINTTIIASINKLIDAYNGSLGDFFEWLGFEAKITKVKKVSIERFSPKLYANGGFPATGEMFIAREKGPELVGSIGNKTAVANNDQIVDAVAQGVTNAIMASGGFGGKRIVIEAKGDASGLMDFISFKQKEEDMQYGD